MKKNLYNFIKKISIGVFVFQILLSGSIVSLLSIPQKAKAAECNATSIKFKGIEPVLASYQRDNRPISVWDINLFNCENKEIEIILRNFADIDSDVLTTTHTVTYEKSRLTVRIRLGEDECGELTGFDCKLALKAKEDGSTIGDSEDFFSLLKYDCEDIPFGIDCSNSIKFELVSKTEEDRGGIGLAGGNEIPPECQDEQGNLRPGCYKLLEPIGGFIDPVFDAEKQGIGGYINTIIRLLLAVATLLAVLMIVAGGVQYMTTDAFSQKSEGISKMTNAVLGLILAFAVYVILNTINPNILNLDPGIKSVTLELEGDTNAPLASSPYIPPQVYCPKSGGSAVLPQVIASLEGKVTYRFGGKGGPPPYTSETKMCTVPAPARLCKEFCPDNTVCLDCSGFVDYTLRCAGLPTHNTGTYGMFTNAETITSISNDGKSVNNILLKPGDIIGWKAGDGGNEIGHVLLYIGDGKVAESRGGVGREPGNALLITNLKDHSKKESLKYVKRIS